MIGPEELQDEPPIATQLSGPDAVGVEGAARAAELDAGLRAAADELEQAVGPFSPAANERYPPLSALARPGVPAEVAKGGDGVSGGVPWRYLAGLRRRGERLHREVEALRESAAALQRDFGQSRGGPRTAAEWAQRSAEHARALSEWGEEVGAYWRDRKRLRGAGAAEQGQT